MNYPVKEECEFIDNYIQENPGLVGQQYFQDPPLYFQDPVLEFQQRMPSDSISNVSSPSTNGNSILSLAQPHNSPETHIDDKPKRKKRQSADDKDAELLARDDAELSEAELQLKRKAQNRAAQRAFRERKETKLKQLEEKLSQSEHEKQKLMEQLDSFKERSITMQAENDLLKRGEVADTQTAFDFPKNEGEFIDSLIAGTHHVIQPEHIRKVYDAPDNGTRVLAVGAVWDYLVYKCEEEGLNIDIVEAMSKLKGQEKCHGFGPAYSLETVDRVIAQCTQ